MQFKISFVTTIRVQRNRDDCCYKFVIYRHHLRFLVKRGEEGEDKFAASTELAVRATSTRRLHRPLKLHIPVRKQIPSWDQPNCKFRPN